MQMCSTKTLVSVIVPVYNVEQYLHPCVDSLLQQSYGDLQIILVDDGSTDASKEICDGYQAADCRVQVIHKKNGGSSSSREAGMNAVKGQYVMFLDGDDWLDADTIEKCMEIARKDEAIGCVMFSYAKEFETATVPMHIMDHSQLLEGAEAIDKVHRRIFGLTADELNHPERMENVVSCCMKLYRTDFAKKGKFFDTKEIGSCEDGLFNIFALEGCKKIAYIDEPLYHYRKHAGSLVSTYKPELARQWKRLFSVMEDYIRCNGNEDRYVEALNNRIALSITAIALNKNGDSASSVLKKIGYIQHYLSDEQYRLAIQNMDMRELPLTWKLLLLCCKYRLGAAVYLGMRIVQRMVHKGKGTE